MNSDKDTLLGYCGLYCGNCLYYLNTIKGTGTQMDDGSTVFCEGCNSSNASPWCTDCGIKKCARRKERRYCLKCADFPCGMMTDFIHDEKYPYHKAVEAMMIRLEEIGLAAWSQEMDKRYTCADCGKKFTYFEGNCPLHGEKKS